MVEVPGSATQLGHEGTERLPRNSLCAFVSLGWVENVLAVVFLDNTPLPARHRGVWIGGVVDGSRAFPGGVLLRAG
jgi:hypothetical protein